MFSLVGYEGPAKIYQQYDLDSAYMAVVFRGVLASFKIRVRHIDGPELRSRDPVEKALAYEGRDRGRQLIQDTVCYVKCFEFDKYGRVLVEIITASGCVYHEWALAEKLAYPYEGCTKKTDWVSLQTARDVYLAAAELQGK